MKTISPHPVPAPSSVPAPRLTCRIVRLWSATLESQATRHIATCASCRRHFETIRSLESALRDEATPGFGASVGSEARILRAVQDSVGSVAAPSKSAVPSRRIGYPLWIASASLAVLAFAVTTGWFDREIPAEQVAVTPVAATPSNAADAAVIVEAVESLSQRVSESVIPSTGAMVADNPLQQEFGYVYADARAALDFLALNFLPRADPASTPRTRI